jgi:hypothetical protein
MRTEISIGLILLGSLSLSRAFALEAVPVRKVGSCPSGYSTSGNYCSPGKTAHFAVEKTGSCPSGYSSSGDYCLAGATSKFAIPKTGSCPSGFSTSGSYCLSFK